MKQNSIVYFFLVVVATFGLQACSERDNYNGSVPSSVNTLLGVTINGAEASVDDLTGRIEIGLLGGTDLGQVTFEAQVAQGVTLSPASGSTIDVSSPFEVVVDNGTPRSYQIFAKVLPSKIAFLGDGATVEDITDDDAKAAAEWTQATYPDAFTYISFEDLTEESLTEVNVIVYVYDESGFSGQPQQLLDKINILRKFMALGGKMVAGQLGCGIVREIGRDQSSATLLAEPHDASDNPDDWGAGFVSSTTASVLTAGIDFYEPNMCYIIDGGSKENDNFLWVLNDVDEPKYATFNSKNNAEIIGTFNWNLDPQSGTYVGVIYWKPDANFAGYFITIGIGGMEWYMDDGRINAFAGNNEALYKNSIDFLLSK